MNTEPTAIAQNSPPPGGTQEPGQQLGQQPPQQQPPQQQPQPPQQQPQPGNQPPAVTVEDLQRQIQEERARAEQYEQRFKETQSAFTRSQQALQQLVGATPNPNTPPADPIGPYVQELTAQGYNEKDARAILSAASKMMQPMQQQMQQQFSALQGQTAIDDVMYAAAASDPRNATLFQNPAIAENVRSGLRAYAQTGAPIDPNIALDMAILAGWRAGISPIPGHQQQQQPGQFPAPLVTPAAQPAPQPFARGMFNFQPSVGAPPSVALPSALTPAAQQVEDEIKQRYGTSQNPPTR